MTGIDSAIQQIEQLYRAATGLELPPPGSNSGAIPPERDPVEYVEQQIERLMTRLGPSVPREPTRPPFGPPVTIWEEGDELRVALDLPGLSKEAVSVALANGSLVVSGRREVPWSGAANPPRPWAVESGYGPFWRAIPLPAGLRSDQLSAEMRHGVLEIRVPRAPAGSGTGQSIVIK